MQPRTNCDDLIVRCSARMENRNQPPQFTVWRNGTFVQRTARRFRQPERQRQQVFRLQIFAVTFGQVRELVHDANHAAV